MYPDRRLYRFGCAVDRRREALVRVEALHEGLRKDLLDGRAGGDRRALADDGLIVQQSESPLIHMDILERLHRNLRATGFSDAQTLFFPQPVYPTGWWSATLGGRHGDLGSFRADDAAARPFATRYYSPEIHRAAFAQPEFFRQARAGWWAGG